MSEPVTFLAGAVQLYQGDCLAELRKLPSESIDQCVCDPPYGIAFMGRAWDTAGPDQRAFAVAFWREVFRVLKPGGHVLAFSANRTVHRMTVAIEDAGFEIRDAVWRLVAADTHVAAFLASLDEAQALAFAEACENSTFGGLMGWVFGTGFPKGGLLPKAIDKALGVEGTLGAPKSERHERKINLGRERGADADNGWQRPWMTDPEAVDAAAREYVGGSAEAQAWAGYGIALKPALEPIVMARKPFDGTLVANVLKHGCGALNIDGCRIEGEKPATTRGAGGQPGRLGEIGAQGRILDDGKGRWPANVITDGSAEVSDAFPNTESDGGTVTRRTDFAGVGGNAGGAFVQRAGVTWAVPKDSGSAARIFYAAKADGSDRLNSKHPTIKPLDLMQYLVRLVGRRGAVILDPFAGTGTTGEAAWREGMRAVLIERDPVHCQDIARRMELATAPPERRAAEVRRGKAAESAERDRKAGKAAESAERDRKAGKARPKSDALSLFGDD